MNLLHHKFYFKALNKNKQIACGTLFALHKNQLLQLLHLIDLQALCIRETKKISLYKKTHMTSILQGLYTLNQAHIPLDDSFILLAQQEKNTTIKSILLHCALQLKQGNSLHNTFALFPHHFDTLILQFILVGEKTGTLNTSLAQLIEIKQAHASLKTDLSKALCYPLFILITGIILSLIVFIVIIPQFQTIYQHFHAPLPLLTKKILALSAIIHNDGLFITGSILFSLFIIGFSYQTFPLCRVSVENLCNRLPMISSLLSLSNESALLQRLALMLKSGIPILECLTHCAQHCASIRLSQHLKSAVKKIEEGQSLEQSLCDPAFLSIKTRHFIVLGEATGSLVSLLEKLAKEQKEALASKVDIFIQLVEPIIITALGILIGLLLIGVYLPLFHLGEIV
jgi:type II secretory pathway component PulF